MGRTIETNDALKALIEFFERHEEGRHARVNITEGLMLRVLRGSGLCKDARTVNRIWDELKFNKFIIDVKGSTGKELSLKKAREHVRAGWSLEKVSAHTQHTQTSSATYTSTEADDL